MNTLETKDSQDKPTRDGGNETDDLHAQLSEHSALIAKLSAELTQQRVDLQNNEVSLITRIADVDDDRRHAATRLQRTLQTQRQELDARLRRHNSGMLMAFLLFSALIASAFGFLYAKLDTNRQKLISDVGELRAAIENAQLSASGAEDQLTREQPSTLPPTIEPVPEASPLAQTAQEEIVPAPHAAADRKPFTEEATTTSEQTLAANNAQQTPPLPQEVPARTDDQGIPKPETSASPPTLEVVEPAEPLPVMIPEPPITTAAPEPLTEAPEPAPETPATPGAQEQQEQQAIAEPVIAPSTSGQVRIGDTPYTIQLMGFYQLDQLRRFAAAHELPATVYYQETTYKGRPWFVLIHSLHATDEAAEAAASTLPPELAKLDIWIRPLDPDDVLQIIGTDAN